MRTFEGRIIQCERWFVGVDTDGVDGVVKGGHRHLMCLNGLSVPELFLRVSYKIFTHLTSVDSYDRCTMKLLSHRCDRNPNAFYY